MGISRTVHLFSLFSAFHLICTSAPSVPSPLSILSFNVPINNNNTVAVRDSNDAEAHLTFNAGLIEKNVTFCLCTEGSFSSWTTRQQGGAAPLQANYLRAGGKIYSQLSVTASITQWLSAG